MQPWAINHLVSSLVTGRVIGGGKSREQLCHEGLGADVWAQLMVKRLASVPPCHIAVPGSQRTPGANLLKPLPEGCADCCPHFHKEESVTHCHIQPNLRTPHLSPWHQLQEPSYWNLQTPRKDSPCHASAETAACAMWLAGQEDLVGTYDVMILSILIAERI